LLLQKRPKWQNDESRTQLTTLCWTSVTQVLVGGPEVLTDIAMPTNFGTQFVITGFV